MSQPSSNYTGVLPTHPDGSNTPGTSGSMWGNPATTQQPTWGAQWGPAPTHTGNSARGGGGYHAGPPHSFTPPTHAYAQITPPAPTTAQPDDAWCVALQTSRELTKALRARSADLVARNTELTTCNEKLEAKKKELQEEVRELCQREATVAARKLEVVCREADAQNRSVAPRFSNQGGRFIAHQWSSSSTD
ncbi:hypothetical protein C8T65DRAFT_745371 [Cerioporus squamosus]|nr:hypothetical protein C8T65DRAFT_745371 [Cerioporus squamosus]